MMVVLYAPVATQPSPHDTKRWLHVMRRQQLSHVLTYTLYSSMTNAKAKCSRCSATAHTVSTTIGAPDRWGTP